MNSVRVKVKKQGTSDEVYASSGSCAILPVVGGSVMAIHISEDRVVEVTVDSVTPSGGAIEIIGTASAVNYDAFVA